jgi:hypothetical protein
MPELAAIYVVGVLTGFLLTAVNIALGNRRRKGSASRTLQKNLRKIDLYWSDNEDKIVAWTETRENEDATKGNVGFAIAGAVISALSWPGVFFLGLLVLSEHVLARSRREKALFASPLSERDDLEKLEVQRLVGELERAN